MIGYEVNKIGIFSVLFLLVFYGCAKAIFDNNGWGKQINGLQCKLEAEKKEYLLGETIVVHKYIKNNSDKVVTICVWPSKEDIILIYYNDNIQDINKDSVFFEKPVSIENSFITINPRSQIYYGSEEFGEEYISKGGDWEIQLIFDYTFTGKDLGVNGWKGILESNILPVTIKSKQQNSSQIPK